MLKLNTVGELIENITEAVETGATFTKLVIIVDRVVQTAELLADVSKSVSGLSAIFYLVALNAQGLSMWAEASRGQRELPVRSGL